MNVTRGITVAALIAGVASGTASTAWADQTMSGHYTKTETTQVNGLQNTTYDWYFSPCGDGCANVTVNGTPGQAHVVNGEWTMDFPVGNVTCADGTFNPASRTAQYTWDPNTLAGTAQVTTTAAVCGLPAGYTFTDNIQLRQAA
jgi:hypothetical protein